MRRGSVGLALGAAFLAVSGSMLLSAGAPAATLPDYRCCFRLDALMTGRLDTRFDRTRGPSDDQITTFTFRTSELVVYDVTRTGPRLRRASSRRGGTRTDGPGVAFGVGRVTTHDDGKVQCDHIDSSNVYTSASNLMTRFYTGLQGRHLRVEVGSAVGDIGEAADRACDSTHHGVTSGPLDGLSAGGATSHLLIPPTRARLATLKTLKLRRERRFGRDVVHEPLLSTQIPHTTTGFVRVELCFTYVGPQRVRSEAAKISALVGKPPTAVTSLRCP